MIKAPLPKGLEAALSYTVACVQRVAFPRIALRVPRQSNAKPSGQEVLTEASAAGNMPGRRYIPRLIAVMPWPAVSRAPGKGSSRPDWDRAQGRLPRIGKSRRPFRRAASPSMPRCVQKTSGEGTGSLCASPVRIGGGPECPGRLAQRMRLYFGSPSCLGKSKDLLPLER